MIVPLELAFATALLLRDRFAIAARVGAFAALGLWVGFAPHDHGSSASFFVGSMLAFWIAGLTTDRRAAAAGWASGMLLVAYAESVFPGGGFGEFLFTAVIQSGVWVAALALAHRGRHAHALQVDLAAAQADREERARHAVAIERARIARELHDVIAHNLSVAIIQLTALLPDIDERDSTGAESGTSRARSRGRLSAGPCRDAPTARRAANRRGRAGAGTRTRARLAVRARRPRPGLAGLELDVAIDGTTKQPPAGVDLAAYRIIQEALTNALKHGHGSPARLALHYRADEIEIEVVNEGGGATTNGDGSGRGLVGMRERVTLYGGTLEAAPRCGGYRVAARLPLDPDLDDPDAARRRSDARSRRLPRDHRA